MAGMGRTASVSAPVPRRHLLLRAWAVLILRRDSATGCSGLQATRTERLDLLATPSLAHSQVLARVRL